MPEGDGIGFFLKIFFAYSFPTSHCGLAGRSHACFELVYITFRVLVALQPSPIIKIILLSHQVRVAAYSAFARVGSLSLQLPALLSLPLWEG